MCTSRFHQVVRDSDKAHLLVRDLNGVEHRVSTLAFEGRPPAVGEWLVCHSGFALCLADPGEVDRALADWESVNGEAE